MHLTFPNVSVSCVAPTDGNLQINLNYLKEWDWNHLDIICDGIEKYADESLQTLKGRMIFLNHVCRGKMSLPSFCRNFNLT